MSIMIQLTIEQEAVVLDVVERGKCAIVTAVPGAGKTTLSLSLAERIAPRSETVLVITYNTNLAVELNKTAESRGVANIVASTIHGLVARSTGEVCSDDTEMLRIIESREFAPLHEDVIMIDESQDLRPLFVEALQCIFARCSKKPRFIVCGDAYQMLYDFPSLGEDRARTDFMTNASAHFGRFTGGREWTAHRFTQSFRLTPNIAAFVNTFWERDAPIVGANDRAPNLKVKYHYCNVYDEALSKVIQRSIDTYGREAVLLVGQSMKSKTPLTAQTNWLYNTPVHIKNDGGSGLDARELARKACALTCCKSKGCEFQVVYFIGFHVFNAALMMSLSQVCVGLSRASAELHVVQSAKEHVYPIKGDLDRVHETYAALHRLRDEGVLEFVTMPPLPELAAPITRTPRDRISVSDCSRLNARDLRDLKLVIASGSNGESARAQTKRGTFDIARSFQALFYDVSDLVGDAIPFMFQGSRGVAPRAAVDLLGTTCFRFIKKDAPITFSAATTMLRRDGVEHAIDPFEGAITMNEFKARAFGRLTRGGVAIDIVNLNQHFANHYLKGAREFCASDGGLGTRRSASAWVYIAAATKASGGYVNRFRFMGSKPGAYMWAPAKVFDEAIRILEAEIPQGGRFEYELEYAPIADSMRLVGRADWVNEALAIVYELKFVSVLSEEHRLQCLVYGAMLSRQLGRDATAVLFNARTGEKVTYSVSYKASGNALERLLALQV